MLSITSTQSKLIGTWEAYVELCTLFLGVGEGFGLRVLERGLV